MRILILNQAFHPDVVATAQIATDLAQELVRRGHTVTAIASPSIYGEKGRTNPPFESFEGIAIRRVGRSFFGKERVLGRLVDFASYLLAATGAALRESRFDVVVVLTTPPFLVLAALFLRALRGTRVLYWVMDVYPDVMVAEGMVGERAFLTRVLRALHRQGVERSDRTVVLGRCMRERLVAQGCDAKAVDVLPVWSPAPPKDPIVRAENAYRLRWNVGPRLLVMYAGNFGLAHDVQTFLRAAEALRDDDRIRFAFVGGGARKAEVDAFVEERGLSNCILEGYQPRASLEALLVAADVHLVTMEPSMEGLVVPSKFYGAVAAGRPCLFLGPSGSEIARKIAEWQCGAVLRIGDVAGLVATLRSYADAPDRLAELGRRGREAMAEEGLVLRGAEPLADHIEALFGPSASDASALRRAKRE